MLQRLESPYLFEEYISLICSLLCTMTDLKLNKISFMEVFKNTMSVWLDEMLSVRACLREGMFNSLVIL